MTILLYEIILCLNQQSQQPSQAPSLDAEDTTTIKEVVTSSVTEQESDLSLSNSPYVPSNSPTKVIPIASEGTAQTVLPVVFVNGDSQQVLLKTTSSLGFIPQDTYLLAELTQTNGVIAAVITGYVENNQLVSIPSEAIAVMGENKTPLQAVYQQQKQGGIAIDRLLLGGLGKALKYDNLPDISFFNGNNTITQTNQDNNLVSGFLEGAIDDLSGQLEKQVSRIPENQSFFYLPAEFPVHLFVKSPLNL